MSLLLGLVGIIFGLFLMGWSVEQTVPNIMLFVNLPGMGIIFGGLIVITFIAYKPYELIVIVKTTVVSFFTNKLSKEPLIERFTEHAKIIMSKGFLGLEPEVSKMHDCPIVANAIELMIAGYSKEDIQAISRNAIIEHIERLKDASRLMTILGHSAPGLGMIGTVLGLIVMLNNMGDDISSIGPAMAIALLTTLYGVFLSTLIFLPLSDKIKKQLDVEKTKYKIVIDGILYLNEKRNYVYVRDALNSHLFPSGKLDSNEK